MASRYTNSLRLKILKRLVHSFKARLVLIIIGIFICLLASKYLLISSYAKIIYFGEIRENLVPAVSSLRTVSNEKRLCDIMPTTANGSWPVASLNVSDEYLDNLAIYNNIQLGGSWKPSDCESRHHVAIVIPYRDRITQLKVFLAHMHPFFKFQKLNYRIFVVEQTDKRPFNRAKLFNIGFKEAENMDSYHCYIFTDVDLLPLNLHNIYACTKLPRHLSANIDVFDFKVPYDWIFGGAISILRTQFIDVNGFSNKFFGWGGEDDDFFNRVTKNGTTICRFEPEISRYTMLSHKKETPNGDRFYYLSTGMKRFESDGLNSLRYTVKSIKHLPLFTNILVDL